MKKIIILLILIIILLVPALHKLTGDLPPAWFVGKFSDSLIGRVSGGITVSFYFIVFLELLGPIFLLISLIQLLRNKKYKATLSIGFINYYLLFLTLTFGSFLVQDYDNGFKDFIYFVGILIIDKLYFSDTKNELSD
ncbi:hypothetical protein OAQ99_05380 [Candidatus Kapabacteria bacterium]|nr:hypothetical protein [Candidatus Kapabacteria bacterium]